MRMIADLRIVGIPEPEASVLSCILRDHGFRVVECGSPEGGSTGSVENAQTLTPRQMEVLRAVRDHGSPHQAAQVLGLSVKTVHVHLDNIYQRIGIRGQIAAVCWACRRGLLD